MIGVQTCPSEENKNVGVEQTHDRSGQPDKHNDAVHHEIRMLNTDNELIRETIAECQRSRIDSEDPEAPESICSSTRPTTESIIQSLQSGIKTNDSGCWKHRIVRITRHGTQNTVQSMFIILGHRHRLLHVRALLAKRNRGEQ